MNAVLDRTDSAETARRLSPELMALDARERGLQEQARAVGRVTKAEDRYIARVAGPGLRSALTKAIANLRRINNFPESNGSLGVQIAEMEAALARLDERANVADDPPSNDFNPPPNTLPARPPADDRPKASPDLASKPAEEAKPDPPKFDPNTIGGAQETIKATHDHFKVIEAVKRLAWGIPSGRKSEVVVAVVPLLADRDIFVVKESLETLATLKDPESITAIIALIDRRETMHDAIETLGKMKDPRAAEAIADRLESAWPAAEKALIAMGPDAESAVIPKLRDTDSGVRRTACKVLAEIGGAETLKVMKKLPADPDFGVQIAARETMKAIAARVGNVADPAKGKPERGSNPLPRR